MECKLTCNNKMVQKFVYYFKHTKYTTHQEQIHIKRVHCNYLGCTAEVRDTGCTLFVLGVDIAACFQEKWI